MNAHRRQLERLEFAHIYRKAAQAGAPFGLSAEDILDECRRFFAQTPEEQAREMGHCYATLTDAERAEMAAIEARYARILRPTTPPSPGRRRR